MQYARVPRRWSRERSHAVWRWRQCLRAESVDEYILPQPSKRHMYVGPSPTRWEVAPVSLDWRAASVGFGARADARAGG